MGGVFSKCCEYEVVKDDEPMQRRHKNARLRKGSGSSMFSTNTLDNVQFKDRYNQGTMVTGDTEHVSGHTIEKGADVFDSFDPDAFSKKSSGVSLDNIPEALRSWWEIIQDSKVLDLFQELEPVLSKKKDEIKITNHVKLYWNFDLAEDEKPMIADEMFNGSTKWTVFSDAIQNGETARAAVERIFKTQTGQVNKAVEYRSRD